MIINYVTKDECDHLLNKNNLIKSLAYIHIHSFAEGHDTFEEYAHSSFAESVWSTDSIYAARRLSTETSPSIIDTQPTKVLKHLWAKRTHIGNNSLKYHDLWSFTHIGYLASTEFLKDAEKKGSSHILIIAPYPIIEILLGYYVKSKTIEDVKDFLQITVLPLALKEGERHEDCIKLLKQILTAKHHPLIKTEPTNRNID